MEITKFLKFSFLIDGLIAMIYGLWMLLLPDHHAAVFGFPYEDFADRLVGSLFIGFSVGNLMAYMKTIWNEVELVVYMNLVFLVIGVLVGIGSIITTVLPIIGLFQVGLMVFLIILFSYGLFDIRLKST